MGFTSKIKKIIKEVGFFIIERMPLLYKQGSAIDKARIRKILVVEGGGIGDLLMLFPAIETISSNFPEASITFLVSSSSKEVLKLLPCTVNICGMIDYDIHGRHKSFIRKLLLINSIRQQKFDLIYAPARGEGIREVSLMVYLMSAPNRIGFKKGNIGLWNTHKIEFVDHLPILEQNINLLQESGLVVGEKKVSIHFQESNLCFARELMTSCALPIFSIHTSASWKAMYKCWPLNNYIELIRELVDLYKGSVILVGSKDEAGMGEDIMSKIGKKRLINTIGRTTIPEMAAVISRSSLFIGNDSGPLHIACALKVPSVALFGPTSHEQLLTSVASCSVLRRDLGCSPCYLHQHNFVPSCLSRDRSVECMQIPVSVVLSAIQARIAQGEPNLYVQDRCG